MDIQFGKIWDKKAEDATKKKFITSMPPGVDVNMIGGSLKEWKYNEILGNPRNQQLFGELLNSLYSATPGRAEALIAAAQAGQLDAAGTTDRVDFNTALDQFTVRMAMVEEVKKRLDDKVLGYLAQPGSDLNTILTGTDKAKVADLLKDKAAFAIMDTRSTWPQDFLKGLESAKKLEKDPSIERIKQRGDKLCKKYGITMDEFEERFDPTDIEGSRKKLRALTRSKLQGWKLASDSYIGHSVGSSDALIRYGEGTLGTFKLTGIAKIHEIYGRVFKDVGNILATTIKGSPEMMGAIADVAKTGTYETTALEDSPGDTNDVEDIAKSFDAPAELDSFDTQMDNGYEIGGVTFASLTTKADKDRFIDQYCANELASHRMGHNGDKRGLLSMWLSSLFKGSWNQVATDIKAKYP